MKFYQLFQNYFYQISSRFKTGDQVRIEVETKDGKYKAQYISDDLSEALDLVVSEKDKKIVFLTPGKLQFLEIK